MLASVQAFYLKHLLYITQTKLTTNVDKDQKDKEIEKEDKKKETMKEILDNMQKKEKEKRD